MRAPEVSGGAGEAATAGAPFVLRSWASRFQMGVIWIPVCVVAWSVPVNLLLPESAIDPVLIPSGIAVALLGLWRARGIALAIDERGFTARNFFRTYTGSWEEVEEIGALMTHGPFGITLAFTLRPQEGGSRERVVAPQAGLAGGAADAKRRCLELLRDIAAGHGIRFGLRLEGSTFRSTEGAE